MPLSSIRSYAGAARSWVSAAALAPCRRCTAPAETLDETDADDLATLQQLVDTLEQLDPVELGRSDKAARIAILKVWLAWSHAGNPGERRKEAISRLITYLGDSRRLTQLAYERPISLKLDGLALTSLPSVWPAKLRVLDISGNQVQNLPADLPRMLVELHASENQLVDLRALPCQIKYLDVSSNHIVYVSEWPAAAESIDASDNLFEEIPPFPGELECFLANDTCLEHLPSLPGSLYHLEAANCELRTLPDDLPAPLSLLDISGNQLASLPESYFQRRPECITRLHGNQFDERTLQRLIEHWRKGTGYCGQFSALSITVFRDTEARFALAAALARERGSSPVPRSSTSSLILGSTEPAAANLVKAICQWAPPSQRNLMEKQWRLVTQHFAYDDNCNLQLKTLASFFDFLFKTSFGRATQASSKIQGWLADLRESRSLLQQTCLIAFEATGRCDDRVLYTYLQMQTAHVVFQLGNRESKSDSVAQLALWVDSARQVFRIELLEKAARGNAQALRKTSTASLGTGDRDAVDAEELETYLAYASAMRDSLDIPMVPKMVHFDAANVSETDLQKTERTVKQQENTHFVRWLAVWEPWLAVMQRIDPDEYEKMLTARETMLDGDEYISRIESRLAKHGLENDDDAWAQAGKDVADRLQLSLGCQLTRTCLKKRHQLHLIEPRWPPVETPAGKSAPIPGTARPLYEAAARPAV